MKKSIYSIIVAMAAYGLCAFTNVKAENSTIPKTYYQISEGVYTDTPPGAGSVCVINSANACTLTFPNDPGISTFNDSQIPALSAQYGTPTASNHNKRYN